jgi:hypothetical protein
MPKIDLRQLLNNTLVANTNEPARLERAERPDDAAIEPRPAIATQRRDSAPLHPQAAARAAPHAAPSVRPHRALRPRRRS